MRLQPGPFDVGTNAPTKGPSESPDGVRDLARDVRQRRMRARQARGGAVARGVRHNARARRSASGLRFAERQRRLRRRGLRRWLRLALRRRAGAASFGFVCEFVRCAVVDDGATARSRDRAPGVTRAAIGRALRGHALAEHEHGKEPAKQGSHGLRHEWRTVARAEDLSMRTGPCHGRHRREDGR